ncbi:MAG: NUDIX hydrolase [Dehalococcoidia bacterium]|nr:NUDIX hydrolase [Dehalococcoidia bacterium]MYA53171.1 NUDIX hydrolase [Dehalococcoidia bacterium]
MSQSQSEWGASRVTVLALDRWGSVLVGGGGPPSAALREGESPDAGALRAFEEATGELLEELKLFRDGDTSHHIYYCDPDLDLAELDPPDGTVLRYVAPVEIDVAELADEPRALLTRFVVSSAYRAMFH